MQRLEGSPKLGQGAQLDFCLVLAVAQHPLYDLVGGVVQLVKLVLGQRESVHIVPLGKLICAYRSRVGALCESGIQKRLAHLAGLNGLWPLRPWTTALRARFALPTGCATVSALRALLVFSKLKIQKLVAVGGGGQREALSTGGGWAVL